MKLCDLRIGLDRPADKLGGFVVSTSFIGQIAQRTKDDRMLGLFAENFSVKRVRLIEAAGLMGLGDRLKVMRVGPVGRSRARISR